MGHAMNAISADSPDVPTYNLSSLTVAELQSLQAEIGRELVRRGEGTAGIYEWVVPGLGVYIG